MPRKPKGKHTCPENAGIQNLTPEVVEKYKADELTMDIMRKQQILLANRTDYKGKWTDEEFTKYVNEFFVQCLEIGIEPSPPAFRLWLGIDRHRLNVWMGDSKYGVKYSVCHWAKEQMEMIYYNKLDSRPVPQMFKLKTGFGYVENQKIEVVAETKVSADEIRDKVSQMITESK